MLPGIDIPINLISGGGATFTFVGAASGNADNIAIPTHQAGDIIIIFAYGGTSVPSLPGGYTTLQTMSAEASLVDFRARCGYKVAASGSETSGTWSGATQIAVGVWRGGSGVGASDKADNDSGTATWAALTLTGAPSLIVGMGWDNSGNGPALPTGQTSRRASNSILIWDSAETVAAYGGQTSNADTIWLTTTVELKS